MGLGGAFEHRLAVGRALDVRVEEARIDGAHVDLVEAAEEEGIVPAPIAACGEAAEAAIAAEPVGVVEAVGAQAAPAAPAAEPRPPLDLLAAMVDAVVERDDEVRRRGAWRLRIA